MTMLTLLRPDDWHVHLRDGPALAAVAPFTAAQFGRAIVMPNLNPPVTTTALAHGYRNRILAALPADSGFEPLMTLYLTDSTPPEEIELARRRMSERQKLEQLRIVVEHLFKMRRQPPFIHRIA